MKTNAKNKKSLKGKWGHVGAPPKKTKFPKTPFTMAVLFGRNKNQCELSLRNKVDALLSAGELVSLKPRKQAGGAVGRPKAVFVLKEHYNATKHTKANAAVKITKTKTVKVKKTKKSTNVVAVVSPAPAVAPTDNTHTPPVVTRPPVGTLAPATAPASPLTTLKEIATEPEVIAPAAPVVESAPASAPEVSVAPAAPAEAPAPAIG
jgi:hypothetical protein